jgi:RNA polymerase sigma factor (sigma-70 family)
MRRWRLRAEQPAAQPLEPYPDPASLESALRRYFIKRVGVIDAEDLVQEVLIRMQSRKGGQAIDNMASYVFAVASNVIKERHRKASRLAAVSDADFEDTDWLTPERIVASRMDMARLMTAIEGLPERTRRVFVAHRFEEMTYNAIAKLFGISVSAVEKHIMAALASLTATLREGDQ